MCVVLSRLIENLIAPRGVGGKADEWVTRLHVSDVRQRATLSIFLISLRLPKQM